MIDFYTWPTPNGQKVAIMLEETGLQYRVIPVDIGKGEQFQPDFLAISPNNRIPAIVDHDGPKGKPISLFESGAILLYLAEKTGRFLPENPTERYQAMVWLMFQMGGIGPMFGQAHHFRIYAAEKIPYAIDRYTNEAGRLYRVLDKHLAGRDFITDAYTIADMATFPWTNHYKMQGQDMADYPNVKRWRDRMKEREAVRKGVELLLEKTRTGPIDDQTREVFFGKTQFQKR